MISLSSHVKYLIGIDEAGRGPLAGPVAVGRVSVARDTYAKLYDNGFCEPYAFDSKTLTEAKREMLFSELKEMKQDGLLDFSVHMVANTVIDQRGITHAVRTALERSLKHTFPHESFLFLDGLLKAPPVFSQQTVTKGDNAVPIISLASVVAKVTRDRYMKKIAQEHPLYGFESHKGYGTKAHRECIQQHGLSPLHRKTFCTALTK